MATTTSSTGTSNPGSCTSSSTGSCSLPMPDSSDSSRRSLSDAGRKRLSSFPSRQRRMGPAPLASFEDLSMDKTTSDSSPEERTHLPDIGEETSTATTPVTPVAKTALSVPASPRIRVSAASSSSPHETDSKESTPEKELFSGYAKSGFCEDMAADLHSSTEELDADEEEQQRKRRDRACKLAELERREEALRTADLNRKGSSSSVLSDGLLPVTSGHSSRLSSLGSIGSARRSPSPHKMLLETSFCGSRPIQQPSIDLEDPPVTTTKIMNFTVEKIERVKSPMEARPPDIFRSSPSTVLPQRQEDIIMAVEAIPASEFQPSKSEILMAVPPPRKQVEAQTAPKKLDAVRDSQDNTAKPRSPREQKSTQPPKSPQAVQATKQAQQEKQADQLEPQQQRQPLSSPRSPRSPRMPKKVPVPQVPDLKDLPKTSPTPSASSSAAVTATTPEHPNARSFSTTPTASPRASRRRRTRGEDMESGSSSPSVSRKSSFSNLFRKSDAVMSPVTPDSPGSSGRKSPFSQFIKSAKKEFRSRSRSRSRSKSRERELEDDTHDRRGVLSIFRPKTKKKDSEKTTKGSEKSISSSDAKLNEAITNVEFTFNDDGKYQPSSFGLIRQESEMSRAIKEPLRGVPPPSEGEPEAPKQDMISSRDSSYNELSSIMSPDGKPAEKAAPPETKDVSEKDKREQIDDDDVFEKPAEVKPTIPSPSIDRAQKEKKSEEPVLEKPHLPPKQKDRPEELTVAAPDQYDADSRSESERESEIEYLKTKAKQQQAAESGVPLDSPDVENKGLVSQDSGEDGELPYVPTTLPTERPLAAPIIPVKERPPHLRTTQSIDRPRSTTPLITGLLEEYKQVAGTPEGEPEKMMINIPQSGPVKVLPTKSPKRQTSKSWDDFCQEGLRSPRQLRKQYREARMKVSEDDIPPPLPPKVRSPARSPVSQPPPTPPAESPTQDTGSSRGTPDGAKSWINFDEMPEIVLKPVRQIKTVPPRHSSQQKQEQREAKPQLEKAEPQRVVEKVQKDWREPLTQEPRSQEERKPLQEEPRRLPPPLPAPLNHDLLDSDSARTPSEASTPDKSSDRSSDSDKPTSPSSEEGNTVRERLEEIKKGGDEGENSDLERLLAPVNECINRLSSLSSEPSMMERRSPIPDNWADFLLPPQPGRRSRLSSLGSDAGSVGGRSPSPSCMLLETSFCGSAPIDDPAAAEPDVPIPIARKLSGVSLGDLCPFTPRERSPGLIPCADRTSILSDSSAEGGGSPKESDYYTRHHSEPQRSQPGAGRQLNPFGMDLGVRSNRSSVVSQDQVGKYDH
ncbi:serine/arginine repetitive matrix protein 1-like [Penaeus indicus]|uniref:serine/arginine repetitive matrix protein 1-like n=1 Tax=Penaeus indicus TaxID=29960 RepID=UPI00300C35C0